MPQPMTRLAAAKTRVEEKSRISASHRHQREKTDVDHQAIHNKLCSQITDAIFADLVDRDNISEDVEKHVRINVTSPYGSERDNSHSSNFTVKISGIPSNGADFHDDSKLEGLLEALKEVKQGTFKIKAETVSNRMSATYEGGEIILSADTLDDLLNGLNTTMVNKDMPLSTKEITGGVIIR